MTKVYKKLGIDVLIWGVAIPLAYLLRVEGAWADYSYTIFIVSLCAIPVKLGIMYYEKFYAQSWRRIGLKDLFSIGRGISIYTILFLIAIFIVRGRVFIPLSIPLIGAMLTFLGMGSARMASRLWHEYRFKIQPENKNKANEKQVLIIGAGEAGTMIAREMLRHPETGMTPVGFLDDDPYKKKQTFLGLTILGPSTQTPDIVDEHNIDIVIIAIPSINGNRLRSMVEKIEGNVTCKVVPPIHELINEKVTLTKIRDVHVEDLLRRDPVKLDTREIAGYLTSKTVLITGAGGSIGSEIVRQVISFKPQKILLLDKSEFNIYNLEKEIKRDYPDINYEVLIATIRDKNTLQAIFNLHKPDVLFHAAAYKHVPLMEANPSQAVLNNITGTKNLVDLSLETDVKRFVNVSTDKAVNPTSIMGASKRISEYVVKQAGEKTGNNKVFSSVRFGNVLGSRGSVVPLFKEQIKNREPVTVTHRKMVRYFMTIPEASQLVLQAGGLNQRGAVYVLDMGEPVKIMDLAHDLIRLSGLTPNVDIPIKITGIRPGEKLYEELLTAEEGTDITRHELIFSARHNQIPNNFAHSFRKLVEAAIVNDDNKVRAIFKELIPTNEFDPTSHHVTG